jgi:hypothetical protein
VLFELYKSLTDDYFAAAEFDGIEQQDNVYEFNKVLQGDWSIKRADWDQEQNFVK